MPLQLEHSWQPSALDHESDWIRRSDHGLNNELEHLIVAAGGNLDALTPALLQSLRIPKLRTMAGWIKSQLGSQGLGLAKLTGLPQDEALLGVASLTLGMLVGEVVDSYGRLYPVYDRGGCYRTQSIPVSQTREPIAFHTDSARRDMVPDALSLTCVRDAEGGHTKLSSMAHIYTQMLRDAPHHYQALHASYVRAIVTPGTTRTKKALEDNHFPIFALNDTQQKITFRYMRYWIEEGQRLLGTNLDNSTVNALDWLDTKLNDPQHHHEQHLKPGEILWIDNRDIAHARTPYRTDAHADRLLYRMWLKVERQSESDVLKQGISMPSAPRGEVSQPYPGS